MATDESNRLPLTPAELLAGFRRQGAKSDRTAHALLTALALLNQARDILDQLIDQEEVEEGSPPYAARWDYLEDAIEMLTPYDDESPEERSEPRLRLV